MRPNNFYRLWKWFNISCAWQAVHKYDDDHKKSSKVLQAIVICISFKNTHAENVK